MTFLTWPNKCWEPGIITHSGKQLWFSRIVTAEDRKRRSEYEDRFNEREEERLCGK